jgi:hypothetical protein
MGLLIRAVGVLVVLVILIGYSRYHRAHPRAPDFPELPAIRQQIDDLLARNDRICVNTVPFPYDSASPPPWTPGLPISGKGYATCDNCADLAQAGLVSQEGSRYELTELGRSAYREKIYDPDSVTESESAKALRQKVLTTAHFDPNGPIPGFCFADKVVVHQVIDALPPLTMGGTRFQSVKFTVEAVNPSPFMFDPDFKLLHLPQPQQPAKPGDPVLYPPEIVTQRKSLVNTDPGMLDGSFRYGAWVNQR